jgi:hypothetical protein
MSVEQNRYNQQVLLLITHFRDNWEKAFFELTAKACTWLISNANFVENNKELKSYANLGPIKNM